MVAVADDDLATATPHQSPPPSPIVSTLEYLLEAQGEQDVQEQDLVGPDDALLLRLLVQPGGPLVGHKPGDGGVWGGMGRVVRCAYESSVVGLGRRRMPGAAIQAQHGHCIASRRPHSRQTARWQAAPPAPSHAEFPTPLKTKVSHS